MWRYWQKRGHLAEARRRLEAIADAPWSRDDPRLRARLMEALGGVVLVAGATSPAMGPAYAEALAIWQSLGDQREIANALYNDSFRYAVERDAGERDPERHGLRPDDRARDLATAARRRARPGERAVGHRQLALLPRRGRPRRSASSTRRSRLPPARRPDDGGVVAPHARHRPDPVSGRSTRPTPTSRQRCALPRFRRRRRAHAGLDDFASIAIADRRPAVRRRSCGVPPRALSAAGGVGLADFVDAQFEFYGRPSSPASIRTRRRDARRTGVSSTEGRSWTLDDALSVRARDRHRALAPDDHADDDRRATDPSRRGRRVGRR